MSDFQNQLTNNMVKLIRSLQQKKNRVQHQLFVAEGIKIVAELMHQERLKVKQIFATANWIANFESLVHKNTLQKPLITPINEAQLQRISNLETPNQVLAVVAIPDISYGGLANQKLHIVLEDIRDPGNLGAIIRIADWFGLQEIYCSESSVDCFNAKVIQAAMGSLFRVKVVYTNLQNLFKQNPTLSVYGTFMNGDALTKVSWQNPAFLLMGNEANGISAALSEQVSQKVSIPGVGNTESLNLSVATGIFVHHILAYSVKTK